MSNFLLYKRISLSNPRPPSGNSPPPATSSAKLKGASQFIRPVPGRLWETLGQHISLLSLLRRNSAAGRRHLNGAGRESGRSGGYPPARPACVGHSAENTLPQFLASSCISSISKEHFLDSIFVSQKMVKANGSKPGTCQKLRQGVPPRIFEPEFLYIAVEICGRDCDEGFFVFG